MGSCARDEILAQDSRIPIVCFDEFEILSDITIFSTFLLVKMPVRLIIQRRRKYERVNQSSNELSGFWVIRNHASKSYSFINWNWSNFVFFLESKIVTWMVRICGVSTRRSRSTRISCRSVWGTWGSWITCRSSWYRACWRKGRIRDETRLWCRIIRSWTFGSRRRGRCKRLWLYFFWRFCSILWRGRRSLIFDLMEKFTGYFTFVEDICPLLKHSNLSNFSERKFCISYQIICRYSILISNSNVEFLSPFSIFWFKNKDLWLKELHRSNLELIRYH